MAESKFTEKTKRALIGAVSRGLPMVHACHLAKVSKVSLWKWKQRAEAGQVDFVDFFEQLEQARAAHAMRLLGVLDDSAKGGDTKTAQWLLTHLHGIGRTEVAVEHTHTVSDARTRELRTLAPEQLEALYARLASPADGEDGQDDGNRPMLIDADEVDHEDAEEDGAHDAELEHAEDA